MAKITDTYLRNLKGAEKMQEILVDRCLYLRVTLRKDGRTMKKWFLRYYDGQKQYRYTIGEYPKIGLPQARIRAVHLRDQAVQGVSLAEQAKQRKAATTFRDLAEEWLEKKSEGWVAGHTLRQREQFGAVLRVFGDKDINQVSIDDIIAVINVKIRQGAAETARRAISLIRQVMEYADTLGRLEDNRILARIDSFRKTMTAPRRERHFYQELTEEQIGRLLSEIGLLFGRLKIETATALILAPYLIVRPNELCGARWEEMNLDRAEWTIPPERMKMSRERIVPLPAQAIRLIRDLHPITGNGEFLFPTYSKARAGSHIRTKTLVKALRQMGYTSHRSATGTFFTTHGFRGMASTLLYQKLQFPGT